jgi:colicin import membrane protein
MPNPPAAVDPVKPEVARADQRRVDEPRLAAGPDAGLREKVVTVLLVMAPGNYGIRRRGPKTADPVLCTTEGCYISTGAGTPARFMPGRKATGFGNTLGGRAGACRQQLGCIFRSVELDQVQNYLQPVDLHILKHDRRQPHAITSDSECRVDGGRISCNRGIYAADYAMWLIPESIADALGPHALQEALEDGLAAPRSADLNPRQMR